MPRASDCTIQDLIAVAEKVDRNNIPDFCGLPNCARPYRALNLCWTHYIRLYKHRKATGWTPGGYQFKDLKPYAQPAKGQYEIDVRDMFCHVPNCQRDYHARGFCKRHYLMWWNQVRREKAQ